VSEILLDLLGFAFADVYIRAKDSPNMTYIKYKVDTGANRTTIRRDLLNDLGYDDAWINAGTLLTGDDRPTVATGLPIDDCYIVYLPEINIGDYVGYNWPFLTSFSTNFRDLLGTSTMQFFNWEINYEKDICRYELIPGKRKVLFNQKEQSMHSLDELDNNTIEE